MNVLTSLADPELVRLLLNGGIGIIPTDTVYGIVARAQDRAAVGRLYRAKQREGKPGTVIAADVTQLQLLGIDKHYLQQAAYLWPAPVSVVLPSGAQLSYLDQGMHSLAVRVPALDALQSLLQQTGPLLTSSANAPGHPPATTIAQAQAYFGNALDFYVEDSSEMSGRASTIVKLDNKSNLIVLRQGAAHTKP